MSPHRAELVKLVQRHGWTRGAELGVDKGILFRQLLESVPSLDLTGVDIFPIPERKQRVFEMVLPFADRCRLMSMTTYAASREVRDCSFDFVFIDADHSDSSVSQDIVSWRPKVRAGGWLGGHDYNPKFPGVVHAVDRVFGSRVQTYTGSIWGVWL